MDEQLTRVTGLLDEVLGPALLGAYLHGSATASGLRPASDLDVLAVTPASLTEAQRRTLTDELLLLSGLSEQVRPVELLVLAAPDVTPWRYPPTADFLYGEWLRTDYAAGRLPGRATMPDLALLLTMARASGQPLLGPPPSALLPAVPAADVRRASVAGVPDLLAELADDTRNVLLTLARVWTTVATGEIRAKDAAADWALHRLPAELRPPLAHARDLYRDTSYADERWSSALRAQARPLADHMVAEIHASAPEGSPPPRS